jgi:hypothetical protein
MPIAQNHARKDAEKNKQNPRTEPKSTAEITKPLTKQNKTNNYSLERKGGKKTAKQIQACYCCSRSGY